MWKETSRVKNRTVLTLHRSQREGPYLQLIFGWFSMKSAVTCFATAFFYLWKCTRTCAVASPAVAQFIDNSRANQHYNELPPIFGGKTCDWTIRFSTGFWALPQFLPTQAMQRTCNIWKLQLFIFNPKVPKIKILACCSWSMVLYVSNKFKLRNQTTPSPSLLVLSIPSVLGQLEHLPMNGMQVLRLLVAHVIHERSGSALSPKPCWKKLIINQPTHSTETCQQMSCAFRMIGYDWMLGSPPYLRNIS